MGPHFPVPQLMTGRHKGWSLPETVMLLVVLSRPEAVTWVKRLWVGVYNILCLSDNNKISVPCWCKTKAVVFSISSPGNRAYSMSTASNRGVSREVFKGVPNSLFSPVVSSFQLAVAAPLSAYDFYRYTYSITTYSHCMVWVSASWPSNITTSYKCF